MISKYTDAISKAIDDYWKENHCPPTLDDLMHRTTITSRNHCSMVVAQIITDGGFRYDAHGKPIPQWVDDLLDKEREWVLK